jgi:Cu-Zn family superoxide dismutase
MRKLLQTTVIAGVSVAVCACVTGDDLMAADDVPAAADMQAASPRVMSPPDDEVSPSDALPDVPGGVTRQAAFLGTDGREVGTAQLSDTPNGLLVRIDVQGIEPGFHAVHFHETGLCEPVENFTTAGGHANPMGNEHGYREVGGSHAGDLPNAYAHQEGHIRTDLFKEDVSIAELDDADGFALMIHAKADDYVSQPSGAAGDRVACAEF